MNIAGPTIQPVPSAGKVDASGGPTRTGVPSAPHAVDGPSHAGQGFGQILAQRLNSGSNDDVPKSDGSNGPPVDAKTPIDQDGPPVATTNAAPVDPDATVDESAAQPALVAPGKTVGAADEPDAVPDRKDGDDAAGNDLAAQLALVSQWAALPPASSAKPAGDAQPGGLDIKGKLDTVRTVMSKGASTTTAAVTKGADLQAQDDAKTVAAGDRLVLSEALLGKIDAAGARGSSDATTFANAFVTQVTSQAATAQAAAPVPTTAQLRETVGTPAWSYEVGQATLRLAASDLQGASLRLNPEHLGPLDVQVRVDNGVAHLAFSAAHADTRAAIESSRTTLDQLFADQGLEIGDCAVGDSSAQRKFDADGAAQGGARRDDGPWGATDAASDDATTAIVTVRRALGLVDTFA